MDKQTVLSLYEIGNDKVKRMLENKFPEHFDKDLELYNKMVSYVQQNYIGPDAAGYPCLLLGNVAYLIKVATGITPEIDTLKKYD